jgi:hypothetical protein
MWINRIPVPIILGEIISVQIKPDVKFKVFWDVAPCSHIEVDRRFRGVYSLHPQGDQVIEAVRTSETSANLT